MTTTLASILTAAALLTASARGPILFASGFETPAYQVGQTIDGVDGWFSLVSPDANRIVNGAATANRGRRAVTCWGGDPGLESDGVLLDGAWAHNASVDPRYGNDFTAYVQCDVRLDGPDTGSGPNDDLVSANLAARNGVGGSAAMFLSSTGDVYCFAGSVLGNTNYAFQTPVPLGQYVTLGISLDYGTHLATFWVNHGSIGTAPFGGQPTERFHGAYLEFAAYDDPAFVDPSSYTGYWDDLLIGAVPMAH